MSVNFSEQPRVVNITSGTDALLLKSEAFAKRVFKHKKQEIESLLCAEQTSNPEQILDYLEIHKQYQDGLEYIFFPETQSSNVQIQTPQSKMERILAKLRYDTTSMMSSLPSLETQACHNFLQQYSASLKRSVLLLKKLYPILKQRADDLEITVSRKIDALETKVERTHSVMEYLFRIAEYMRNWSLQLIHDPKECDLDEFSSTQPAQSEPVKKYALARTEIILEQTLVVSEEKKDIDLFKQYEKLVCDFNNMIDICIEEIRDFKELTKMMQPEGRIEKIQQRANEQELSMNTTSRSSQLRVERWKSWRDGIVKYLSSWASVKSLPSNTGPNEYIDLETGGQYAKK